MMKTHRYAMSVSLSLLLAAACGKSDDTASKAPPAGDQAAETKDGAMKDGAKDGAMKDGAKDGAMKDGAMKDGAMKDGAMKNAEPADKFATYAALDVGADYAGWGKLNKEPVMSKTHGGRFVDTYVNEVGASAYKDDDAEIPVGTVIVKTSWETEDGKPTKVAGPTFVMERRAGKDGGEATWFYGLHWENVPEKWQEAMGGAQAYWRTPSAKVDYCSKCHNNYDRELGSIPKDKRAY